MPLPEEPEKEFSRESEKTDPVNKKDGIYKFWWNRNLRRRSMDFEKTPNLTYFLLASPNLEDEIHFKGGRFVTSQNSKFWNVIINR